ncbi:MAG TPA: class IV adenylate cyclase [Pyrinomonadaceae bacterium]|jgi:adenylate cyclase class 2|nr:class IV adenylate cyclase [Pyrinomonadaceae bacterium]
MNVEIEKKYRLSDEQAEALRRRLSEVGAESCGEEFEENTLYAGPNLEQGNRVLRLRRVGGHAVLTFKERFESASLVKRQREDETRVEDADALASILDALGYRPALVYEKRRATWRVCGAEVVVDELPFGLFAEIEGEEDSIRQAETLLNLDDAEALHETYPHLTRQHGSKNGDRIEARFPPK